MSNVFDYLHRVAEMLVDMQGDIASLEARVERMFRKGKVTDVDATQQKYRQEIGLDDDGNPVKSPWVRYAQFAGDRRTHTPPFVGQQFMLFSPDGDHEQGHGIPLTFSTANPSPSQDPNSHVDQWGNVTTTLTKDNHVRQVENVSVTHDANGLTINAGGTSFVFAQAGFTQTGGKQTHDSKNVGSDHKHGGVQQGSSDTDVPEA